jgi:hypothetical protein
MFLPQDHEFYSHIFNGCYASLLFVVVIFFLIYGVEVFFKVRGGFTVQRVPKIINSRRWPLKRTKRGSGSSRDEIRTEEQRPMVEPGKFCGLVARQSLDLATPLINQSQLHQSRLGLLSQALMMMVTVGFLFSETLSEFWKPKVDLTSQNTHVVVFRVVEIGEMLIHLYAAVGSIGHVNNLARGRGGTAHQSSRHNFRADEGDMPPQIGFVKSTNTICGAIVPSRVCR